MGAACWCRESIDTDLRGEPGLERRKRALLVTLGEEIPDGIEVEKSSMDIEFCRDKGVVHLEPADVPEPVPIRDRGLLSQEES